LVRLSEHLDKIDHLSTGNITVQVGSLLQQRAMRRAQAVVPMRHRPDLHFAKKIPEFWLPEMQGAEGVLPPIR
jgi:hypothetical protein